MSGAMRPLLLGPMPAWPAAADVQTRIRDAARAILAAGKAPEGVWNLIAQPEHLRSHDRMTQHWDTPSRPMRIA